MANRVFEYVASAIVKQLAKCGDTITLHKDGKELKFVGFIQPDVNRNRKFLEEDYTSVGRADTLRYLYRGTMEGIGGTLKEGDILSCAAGSFRVITISDYYLGSYPVYRSGWLGALNNRA